MGHGENREQDIGKYRARYGETIEQDMGKIQSKIRGKY